MRRPFSTKLRRALSPRRAGAFALGLGLGLAVHVTAAAAPKSPFPKIDAHIQGAGAATQPLQAAPAHLALASFRLDYTSGHDTTVRDLGVEQLGRGQTRAWLSDDDGGSPLELRARWYDVSGSPTPETRHLVAQCKAETCRVGTLDHGSDKIPLLVGFAFHNLSGAKKITRVAIYPEVRTGPNKQVTYWAKLDADGKTNYTVDLRLVLVDPSVVGGQYDASASSEPGKPLAEVPVKFKYGFLGLQGFDVRFKNGSHHLQELAVEPIKGTNAVLGVYLSDKNDDDPISAKLWWADLKPPGTHVIPNDKPIPKQTKPMPGGKLPGVKLPIK